MASVIRGAAVWLAVVGFCLPQAAWAAQLPQTKNPTVADVALHEGGVLLGQVVNPQGAPLADVAVSLRTQEREIAQTSSDDKGYFAFRGLGGGVYHLVTAEGHGAYRVWTTGSAPPTAQQGALVVIGDQTVRSQFGAIGFWLSHPWVCAAIVATAIAVPVAIHNTRGPSSP